MAARGGGWRGVWRVLARSEVADADGAVRVNAEDFVKGEHGSGRSRDDRAANDTHFALVNVAAPDGEPAVDDGRDAEDETEHHDHGKAVADTGLEFGGVERLREGRHGVEGEDGSGREDGGQPRTDFSTGLFDELHTRLCYCCLSSAASPPNTR